MSPLTYQQALDHLTTRIHVHPAAALYPLLPEERLCALSRDIQEHGQQHPIEMLPTDDGTPLLLDGRNRLIACLVAGIEPVIVDVEIDEASADAYVQSQNVHRRHLSTSARAMTAARWQGCAALHTSTPTLRLAAERFQVSRRLVASAKKILADGSPELVSIVDREWLSVSLGAAVAGWPHVDQLGLIVPTAPTPREFADAVRRNLKILEREAAHAAADPGHHFEIFDILGVLEPTQAGDGWRALWRIPPAPGVLVAWRVDPVEDVDAETFWRWSIATATISRQGTAASLAGAARLAQRSLSKILSAPARLDPLPPPVATIDDEDTDSAAPEQDVDPSPPAHGNLSDGDDDDSADEVEIWPVGDVGNEGTQFRDATCPICRAEHPIFSGVSEGDQTWRHPRHLLPSDGPSCPGSFLLLDDAAQVAEALRTLYQPRPVLPVNIWSPWVEALVAFGRPSLAEALVNLPLRQLDALYLAVAGSRASYRLGDVQKAGHVLNHIEDLSESSAAAK